MTPKQPPRTTQQRRVVSPLLRDAQALYRKEFAQIQQEFDAGGNGVLVVEKQAALVDSLLSGLWRQCELPAHGSGVMLIAVGEFGRRLLFPYGEAELLLLHATEATLEKFASGVRHFSEILSDLPLKTALFEQVLGDYRDPDREGVETLLSLLDGHFIAGDAHRFADLRERLIPEAVTRESHALVERLTEVARTRHRKFGDTIFHLEPNVKDGPGGTGDYALAMRLALVSALETEHHWPAQDAVLPPADRDALRAALEFVASVRCFLNFRRGLDDHVLSWDAQEQAAAQGVATGAAAGQPVASAEWMRLWYRHAAAVYRAAIHLLEEIPAAQSLFYRQIETWRTGFTDADFSVIDGLIFLRHPQQAAGFTLVLRTVLLIARRGFKLAPETENLFAQSRQALVGDVPEGPAVWDFLQELLKEPHAADALRVLHSLHLLTALLPEWRQIDALAVRDLSHRFTVDEHTLRALAFLRELRQPKSKWEEQFAELVGELDQPELLDLAILLHDSGKVSPAENHIPASLALARACMDRFRLPPEDRDAVLFLIEHHLDMGATLRRDIYDPRTIEQFAERVGTPDRLKMLCLFTCADLKATSPESLTPWKAEDLWQLYIATANDLAHSADDRVRADAHDEVVIHLRTLAHAAGEKLQTFLDGLPRRYLRLHPVDEILRHFEMAGRLGQNSVQLALKRSRHWYELTVVTRDRPFLFATMAGALAATGMDIRKAGAFSNRSGVVVDTFHFTDRFRTLEMNLPAWERFKETIHAVLTGKESLERLLNERLGSEKEKLLHTRPGPLQVQFDDRCSAHSTLIEVMTRDVPGLLYRISSVFSRQSCNIDIALIDTENDTAIDVFYLTFGDGKLPVEQQERLRQALIDELAAK